MSRIVHITKLFALLACFALLLCTVGCSGGSVVAPSTSSTPQVDTQPNFSQQGEVPVE
jgi:hypothetical protein